MFRMARKAQKIKIKYFLFSWQDFRNSGQKWYLGEVCKKISAVDIEVKWQWSGFCGAGDHTVKKITLWSGDAIWDQGILCTFRGP